VQYFSSVSFQACSRSSAEFLVAFFCTIWQQNFLCIKNVMVTDRQNDRPVLNVPPCGKMNR